MKFLILTKKQLISGFLIFVALILVLILGSHLVSKTVGAGAPGRKLPIYSVQTDKKQVALSFDAAWGNEDTEQLIEIFKKYDIKVTFFVVGKWVDKYPESVKALHDAGHSVQNHSDTHPHLPKLGREDMLKEITAANEKIAAVTGKTPTLLRPPYGDYNNALIEVLASQNMFCIQWDVDSLDWKDKTAEQIQQIVLKKVGPGSIVLFHNAAKNTPAALPGIIEALQKDGYEFVLIEDLIYKENYTIDHTGRQIPQTGAASGTSSPAPNAPGGASSGVSSKSSSSSKPASSGAASTASVADKKP